MVNIFGIAIGIALFVSINSISTAYKSAAALPLRDIGTDLIVQRAEKHPDHTEMSDKSMRGIKLPFSNQLFRPQDIDVLSQIDGIAADSRALLLWEFSDKGFHTIIGVDGVQSSVGVAKAREWVNTGRFPEKPDEIALEKHFAKFQKTAPGNTFLVGGKPFRVVGLIEIKEGAQVAAANIYMPLGSAQLLLGKEPDALNVIYLRLENPSTLHQVKAQLARQIPGASISSSDSFLEIMGGVSKVSETFALIASFVGVFGAIALVMKAMLSNIVERSNEIGVLKAVGWTQHDVQRQLRIEAFLQTVAGGVLGVMAGYAMSILMGLLTISIPIPWELNPAPAMARQSQAAAQAIRLPVSVSLSLAASALGLSVVTGFAANYMMSRRAAGMKPADSLRRL
jgi:putative ABC transport system permease protein